MSRVGKKPISIPDKVKITYQGGELTVQGQKGKLSRSIHPAVTLKMTEGVIAVEPLTADKTHPSPAGSDP